MQVMGTCKRAHREGGVTAGLYMGIHLVMLAAGRTRDTAKLGQCGVILRTWSVLAPKPAELQSLTSTASQSSDFCFVMNGC